MFFRQAELDFLAEICHTSAATAGVDLLMLKVAGALLFLSSCAFPGSDTTPVYTNTGMNCDALLNFDDVDGERAQVCLNYGVAIGVLQDGDFRMSVGYDDICTYDATVYAEIDGCLSDEQVWDHDYNEYALCMGSDGTYVPRLIVFVNSSGAFDRLADMSFDYCNE